MTVQAVHPACGASSSYAFGPLYTEGEDFKCGPCGERLLRFTTEEADEVPDAWTL